MSARIRIRGVYPGVGQVFADYDDQGGEREVGFVEAGRGGWWPLDVLEEQIGTTSYPTMDEAAAVVADEWYHRAGEAQDERRSS